MNIADAQRVFEGQKVTSSLTTPARRPLRVTQVWHSSDHSIVRFRIHSLGSSWIDSSGVELPPKGATWNDWKSKWEPGPSDTQGVLFETPREAK